jgi:hypothetical protein
VSPARRENNWHQSNGKPKSLAKGWRLPFSCNRPTDLIVIQEKMRCFLSLVEVLGFWPKLVWSTLQGNIKLKAIMSIWFRRYRFQFSTAAQIWTRN